MPPFWISLRTVSLEWDLEPMPPFWMGGLEPRNLRKPFVTRSAARRTIVLVVSPFLSWHYLTACKLFKKGATWLRHQTSIWCETLFVQCGTASVCTQAPSSLADERNLNSNKVSQFQKDFITNPFIYKNVINKPLFTNHFAMCLSGF